MRKTFFIIFLLFAFRTHAQEIYSYDHSLNINQDGKDLSSSFSGGINSAQIQTMDVDGDDVVEWVIWDINSRELQVYKKQGEIFTHIPEFSYFLPSDIAGFLILIDFDSDGKKDLFTSTPLGIKAYKNTSIGNNLTWTVAQNFLRIDGSGNIQANNLDTPLIQDLDEDGDLDLVIFNFASGDYLEFYENTSIDRKFSPDVDGFAFPKPFWGNFVFCGCGDISFGETCSGIDLKVFKEENNRIQHAGGHSILYQDFDGDGISDLVLGRDECSILYFLPNTGTKKDAKFESFSNELPNYGSLPEFPIFHNAQSIDNDLIISLNTNEAASNFGIDFSKSIVKIDTYGQIDWKYLQNQMLDLGENSRPFFSGSKNSGDLIVTANTFNDSGIQSQATNFSFDGSSFLKTESDFQTISNLNLLDVQWIEYQSSDEENFTLFSGISVLNNIPNQVNFRLINDQIEPFSLAGYSPQRGDHLEFFVYENEDFLLVAAQNGSLDLYQVNFESMTASILEEDFLGFGDNPANRNLNVAVHKKPNPDLFAVDQLGQIMKISDFMNSSSRTEIVLQIGNQNLPSRLGRNTWISIVNPFFDEAPDLILGTRGGGLIYLKSENIETPSEEEFKFKVYPNPSNGPIKILSNLPAKGRIINSFGQILLENIQIQANQELEIQAGFLPPALYIIQLEVNGKFSTSRKMWIQ